MMEKFADMHAPQDGVRLDDIQDAEKPALRSQLARLDTTSDDGKNDAVETVLDDAATKDTETLSNVSTHSAVSSCPSTPSSSRPTMPRIGSTYKRKSENHIF
jgi:hypothetical protein